MDLSEMELASSELLALVRQCPSVGSQPRRGLVASVCEWRWWRYSWVEVEETLTQDIAWRRHAFAIADYVPLTDAFQIKFTASDSLRPDQGLEFDGGSLIEAGVDDLIIHDVATSAVICEEHAPRSRYTGLARAVLPTGPARSRMAARRRRCSCWTSTGQGACHAARVKYGRGEAHLEMENPGASGSLHLDRKRERRKSPTQGTCEGDANDSIVQTHLCARFETHVKGEQSPSNGHQGRMAAR